MPVTGGLCPFPLRLGGDGATGWTAEQHARACADAVAMGRTAPFARLRVSITGGSSGTILSYAGMNGIGLANAPTMLVSFGIAQLFWPSTWTDGLGRTHATNIRVVTAGAADGQAGARVESPASVSAAPHTVSGGTGVSINSELTITVYGSPLEDATIGDYGGALDKQASELEAQPYAAGWLSFFESARGSAFRSDRQGLVHAENLALARHYAWQTRLVEQFTSNQNPATAGVSLGEWVTILALDPSSTDAEKRAAGAAKQSMAALGNTPQAIDSLVSSFLGDRYVKNWRTPGTLTDPPGNTYGPAWETGPVAWDMGGGVWSSTRSKLTIEVTEPSDADRGNFDDSMGRLFALLDDLTPAYMTFNWATGISDPDDADPEAVRGFRLDLDRMDYVGLS